MKIILLLFFLFAEQICFSQSSPTTTIDTSNYYEKFTSKGSLNWLRESDAIPIIIDEIEKNGYSYAFISIGKLLKLDNDQYLVTSVSYDNGQYFGFIYKSGHGLPINKSDRDFLTKNIKSETQYVQYVSINDSSTNYMRIKKLPKNNFILDEHCYWYEFDSKGKVTYPVSKEAIIQILRQDIRGYLTRLKR